ncbi:putative testis-expressed protein 13C, partial [Puma concolor]|uniref:Testis-expressed protein 13C n=1 Tax=Puma concolor TaxID=9696 RepID=A0A6P6H7I4_PUMCO
NDEVLVNGGGPDFYAALRSRPWDEVEERLPTVLADPQVPRAMKRACAWSALALSVRVGARQREQQERQVSRLQNQVDERETTTWALASELQRLRGECESAVTQLRSTQASLRQTLVECDVLRGRLLQVERASRVVPLARERVPGPPAEPLGAIAWPRNADVVARELRSRLYFEARVPAPVAVFYVPGPPSPWAQAVQPALPVPVRYLLPFRAPFPVGFPVSPPLPPVVVMDAEAAVVPHQMPPLGIGPPGPRAAVGYQEGMVPRWDQRSCSQAEGPAILQSAVPLRDIRSLSQEGPQRPQGTVPVRDSWSQSQSQEEDPENTQEVVPLGDSWSHSQQEDPERAQGTVPVGESRSHNQEEGPERAQGVVPAGDSQSQSQEEGPEWAKGMATLGDGWSQSQEDRAKRAWGMVPVGESWSHSQQEDQEVLRGVVPLGESWTQSQREGPENPQGMVTLWGSWSQSREEGPGWAQGMVPVGDSWSHSQEEDREMPQGVVLLRDSWSLSQEDVLERPQGMVSFGDSWSQSRKEGSERPRGVVLLKDNQGQSQEEGPENPQEMVPFGDSWSLSQEEGPAKAQGMEMVTFGASRMNSWEEDPERPQEMGASGRHNQEEDPKRPQVMVPLGASRDHSQEEGPKRPQGMAPLVASRSSSHEEDPERPQEMLSLGASGNYSQEEGPRKPQGTGDRRRHSQQQSPKRYPPGFRRSHSLEEGLQSPQATPQGDSWSCGVRESPMKQQPQGQKAKQPKEKKALGFLHQEKSASGCGPERWECPWCKAMNFSWRMACCKCKEGCVEVESGDPDPGPTH